MKCINWDPDKNRKIIEESEGSQKTLDNPEGRIRDFLITDLL
jgi:hypothetical protein